jgi:hypothetical protein
VERLEFGSVIGEDAVFARPEQQLAGTQRKNRGNRLKVSFRGKYLAKTCAVEGQHALAGGGNEKLRFLGVL